MWIISILYIDYKLNFNISLSINYRADTHTTVITIGNA